jgi:hypothetical protein
MDSARLATTGAVRTQFLELAQLWLAAATEMEHQANGKTTWPTINRPIEERPSEEV